LRTAGIATTDLTDPPRILAAKTMDIVINVMNRYMLDFFSFDELAGGVIYKMRWRLSAPIPLF
jgi:hypothetical protein